MRSSAGLTRADELPAGASGRGRVPPAALLLAVLVAMSLGPGCARRPDPGEPGPAPAPLANTALVAEGHLFAPYHDLLLQPAGVTRDIGVQVPDPMRPQDIQQARPFGAVDMASMERGLRGRADALVDRYRSNVQRRQQQSAQVAIQSIREDSRPELDEELGALEDELAVSTFQARANAGQQINNLRLRLAVLDSRILNFPGEVPETLTQERVDLRAELERVQAGVESRIQQLEQEHQAQRQAAIDAWNERLERLATAERQQAEEQAAEQIARKRQTTDESVESFILRVQEQLRPGPQTTRTASGQLVVDLQGSDDAARQLERTANNIRQKMRSDAQLAAELVRETAHSRSTTGTTARVNARASRLIGVR